MPLDATHTIRSGIAWRTTLSNFYCDLKKSHLYFLEIWHHFSNGYNFWPSEKISFASISFERGRRALSNGVHTIINRSIGPELEPFENLRKIPKKYHRLFGRIKPKFDGLFSITVRFELSQNKNAGRPVATAIIEPKNSRLFPRIFS